MRAAPLSTQTLTSAHCALCGQDFAFQMSLHPHKKFVPHRISLFHMGVERQSCPHSLALAERNTIRPFKTWAVQSPVLFLRAFQSQPLAAHQKYQPTMCQLYSPRSITYKTTGWKMTWGVLSQKRNEGSSQNNTAEGKHLEIKIEHLDHSSHLLEVGNMCDVINKSYLSQRITCLYEVMRL